MSISYVQFVGSTMWPFVVWWGLSIASSGSYAISYLRNWSLASS